MMRSFTLVSFTFIYFAFISYFTPACASTLNNEDFITPSGKAISKKIILQHLPSHLFQSLHESVFEVTLDGTLSSHTRSINVKVPFHQSRHLLNEDRSLRVTVNGIETDNVQQPVYSHVVDDAVVITAADDTILAVWGNDISLVPLDLQALPGLYVNRHLHNQQSTVSTPTISANGIPLTFSSSINSAAEIPSTDRKKTPTSSCIEGKPQKAIELAVAFDNTFCAQFGHNRQKAISAVRALVEQAEKPYRIQTCLRLRIVHIEAHCRDVNDPYKSFKNMNSSVFFDSFRVYWSQNRRWVRRDVAYLFTGFDEPEPAIGLAYIGQMCTRGLGYGWVEVPIPFVLSHELGHSLNGQHTNAGIMKASYDPATKFLFSNKSLDQMMSFVDNEPYMTKCLRAPWARPLPPARLPAKRCCLSVPRSLTPICDTFMKTLKVTKSGAVNLHVKLQYNRFDVTLFTSRPSLTFSLVKQWVSHDPHLGVYEIEEYRTVNRTRSDTVKWPLWKIGIAKGRKTCCGQTIYFYSHVFHCTAANECGFFYTITPYVMPCKVLCGGDHFQMTARRRCPRC